MPFNGKTNTFNIVSELKTQIGNPNSRVTVLGYHNSGDCGGGEFYWDSTSTEADNGGTIFQVTGVSTGRWKRVIQDNNLNVMWFGAKNDYSSTSTTDNTSAINLAIAAAVTLRNKFNDSQTIPDAVCIYFPNGAGFRITDTITIPYNICVTMDGQLVFDNPANDRPALVIGDSNRSTRRRYIVDVTNKNTTIWPPETSEGEFTTNSIGVKFRNQTYCDIIIRRAVGFAIGAQVMGDNGNGFVYNEVQLGIMIGNKVQLDLASESAGWCNENNFYGGRFSTSSNSNNNGKNRYGIRIGGKLNTDEYYYQNNNVFYKPCFELNGALASPGYALPILIVSGSSNTFYSCRDEGNFVAGTSTIFVRTLNASGTNYVDVGAGNLSAAEDLGTRPSTIINKRSRTLLDGNFSLSYISGSLSKCVCPYDDTKLYAADDLFFLNSTDAGVYEFTGNVLVTADYLELPSNRGIGVRIDTTTNKRFVAKHATLAGNRGRIGIRCFDASGAILYTPDLENAYVKGMPSLTPNPNSSFGGHYGHGSDSINPMYFVVSPDVAYIDVFVKGGTTAARVRQFQVQAIDWPAGLINLKSKNGFFATKIPTIGTWTAGDVIYNATPASNNIVMWQCTVSGTPGTWVSVYNSNKTVTSVNGSTGDVVVAPVTGGTGYIQNTGTLQPSSNFYISGQGVTNGNFQVRRDGSDTLSNSYALYNVATTRGANLQLNGDVNPGLATYIHNGTSWTKRLETFSTGLTAFYPSSGDAVRMVHDSAFISAYNTANSTRTGYLQFNTSGNTILGVDINQGLSFSTNGVVRQTITASGNIGIGITSPTEKLVVSGNIFSNGLNGVGILFNGPSSIVRDNSEDLKISTNRLGLNTTATARSTFDVIGNVFVESTESIRTISDGGFVSFYNSANTTRSGYLQMNTIGGCILSVDLNQPLSLRTNSQERLFIESDGDVGIGVHTPASKLDVNGQITIRGGSPGTGKVLTSDASGIASWQFPSVPEGVEQWAIIDNINTLTSGTYTLVPAIPGKRVMVTFGVYEKRSSTGTGTQTFTYSVGTNPTAYDNMTASTAGSIQSAHPVGQYFGTLAQQTTFSVNTTPLVLKISPGSAVLTTCVIRYMVRYVIINL